MLMRLWRRALERVLGALRAPAEQEAAAHVARGIALADRSKHAAAAVEFNDAIRVAPEHAEAHFRLGLARRDQGQLADAVESYRRAVRLQPAYAEAHNNLGAVLQLQGENTSAIAAYRRAVELAPDFSQPYLNLGRLLMAAGDTSGAAEIYNAALARGIDTETFGHLLVALRGTDTQRAPEQYTRRLFDGFAAHFDARLVGELDYRLPELLSGEVRAHGGADGLRILDLGCGTGLCGPCLAPQCAHLAGVDLSPAMLEQARARGVYDELHEMDVIEFMRQAPELRYDAIIAADVFIYLGELSTVFSHVARLLRDGGVFVFSIETTRERDFVLQPSGRYAQSEDYVRKLALDNLLRIVKLAPAVIRGKPGQEVHGALCVLARV